MAYEQRDNSGSLFRNERKERETHPDYTGNGMIDGKSYWFSAWIKKDRNGKTFMSLAFKPKDEQPQPATQPPRKSNPVSSGRNADMNDEIPF